MSDELALWQTTAEHLAGRSVLLRLQQPVDAWAWGETYLNHGGQVVIDLRPGLPPAENFRMFLHEVAHARLHMWTISPSIDSYLPAGSDNTPPAGGWDYYRRDPREQEADALAGIWAKWAEPFAKAYPDRENLAKILALQYWQI